MPFHKFIKIKGEGKTYIGYCIPNMYQLVCSWPILKAFGFWYIKERLTGWTIWWVSNEDDYNRAIETLEKLKERCAFVYKVSG